MKKKTVNELNQELTRIDAEYAEYEKAREAELAKIADRLEVIEREGRQKKNAHQATHEQLTKDRNEAALEEKLKAFPKNLVEGHKFCKVCNAAMRPFEVVENNATVKYWACQAGSLRIDHDLVKV